MPNPSFFSLCPLCLCGKSVFAFPLPSLRLCGSICIAFPFAVSAQSSRATAATSWRRRRGRHTRANRGVCAMSADRRPLPAAQK